MINHTDPVIPSNTTIQFPEESVLLYQDLQDLISPIADEPIAPSIEYTQTAQILADLNSESDDAEHIVSEDSDVSNSSRLVVVESESQIVTSQSDASDIDDDNKQVDEPLTPPEYLKGFVKAKSPLHLEHPTLKRPLSTDDESLDLKKSKTPDVSITGAPNLNNTILDSTNIISTSSPIMLTPFPCLIAPPKITPKVREYTYHGSHQFPTSLTIIQKRKQLFKEQNPVAIDLILDMIILSDYDFSTLIDDPLHQTDATELDKNLVTSKLLYLLVGQDEDLISSWPISLPPLPNDISEQWRKLCKNRTFPKHHESVNKLVSTILKVTLKTVEHGEIEEEIQRMKQKLKLKSIK